MIDLEESIQELFEHAQTFSRMSEEAFQARAHEATIVKSHRSEEATAARDRRAQLIHERERCSCGVLIAHKSRGPVARFCSPKCSSARHLEASHERACKAFQSPENQARRVAARLRRTFW